MRVFLCLAMLVLASCLVDQSDALWRRIRIRIRGRRIISGVVGFCVKSPAVCKAAAGAVLGKRDTAIGQALMEVCEEVDNSGQASDIPITDLLRQEFMGADGNSDGQLDPEELDTFKQVAGVIQYCEYLKNGP